jgi:alkanesulfonate monooxygenase SsuD/methylene tetrahydromethanopterin reductase-like flavin-dependent oxidoreductase (luciferase family)
MKFGLHYQLACSDAQTAVQRYRDTIDQAVYAEALGFESVWPVEQHFNPNLSILPSPLLLLAAIAERTRALRLGIAIVLLPLSHPVRVAEEVATLDVISNGRIEFGVGRGAIPNHFQWVWSFAGGKSRSHVRGARDNPAGLDQRTSELCRSLLQARESRRGAASGAEALSSHPHRREQHGHGSS